MNIVTNELYSQAQTTFVRKHPIASVDTSPMRDNSYTKTYIAEDNAVMWECVRLVTETAEVEVKGIKCKVDVKLWEYECWSTEFKSMYFYERA